MDDQKIQELEQQEYNLSPEQLERIKRWRLWFVPFRLLMAFTFFSLMAGGPEKFFSWDSPASIAFAILFSIQVFTEKLIQPADAGGRWKDKFSVAFTWIGFGSCFFLSIIDWFWVRPSFAPIAWSWVWIGAGALIFALGQTLRVISIRTLGRFFTISVRVHKDHQVVQDGPYRLIRHPAYTGLMIIILGHVTLFASFLGYLAFLGLALPALAYRIRVEERALSEEMGQGYVDYMRRTKRLIPYLL